MLSYGDILEIIDRQSLILQTTVTLRRICIMYVRLHLIRSKNVTLKEMMYVCCTIFVSCDNNITVVIKNEFPVSPPAPLLIYYPRESTGRLIISNWGPLIHKLVYPPSLPNNARYSICTPRLEKSNTSVPIDSHNGANMLSHIYMYRYRYYYIIRYI